MLGTFLEGETVLILAGFAAHMGYMNLYGVILAAFIGSICGDQLYFFLGRRHSDFLLKRRPSWRPKLEKADRLINRFHIPIILGFRFLYGLRTLIPFALGISNINFIKYVIFNVIGAAVWAAAVGGGSALFGNTLELILGDVKRYELEVFSAIIVTGSIIWIIYLYRRKKKMNGLQANEPDNDSPGDLNQIQGNEQFNGEVEKNR